MLVLIAAALLAQAQTVAPASSTSVAAAKPHVSDGDKVVCRTSQQTGSLFGGPKECHTKNEWAAINAASRDDVNSFQQRTNQAAGGPH